MPLICNRVFIAGPRLRTLRDQLFCCHLSRRGLLRYRTSKSLLLLLLDSLKEDARAAFRAGRGIVPS